MMEVGRYTMVRIAHKSAAMDENRCVNLYQTTRDLDVAQLV